MVLLSLQVCLFCHLLTFLFISILFCIFSSVASQICLGIFARLNKMRNVFLLFAYVRYMVYGRIQVLCFEWPLSTWSTSTLQMIFWIESFPEVESSIYVMLRLKSKRIDDKSISHNVLIRFFYEMKYKSILIWSFKKFTYHNLFQT